MNGYIVRELRNAPAIQDDIVDFMNGHEGKIVEETDGFTINRDDGEIFSFSAEIRLEDLNGSGVLKAYTHISFYNSYTGEQPYILPTEVA